MSDKVEVDRNHRTADCEKCLGKPERTIVVNHNLMWHDGDVICAEEGCGRFERRYDAG